MARWGLATLVTLKAQREGQDSLRLRQAKVTDTHADQSGCREILRVGGTGLCALVMSQEGTEW